MATNSEEKQKRKLLKKPIDGKQQFGDKSICRLCHLPTSQEKVICNRCHFKYHPNCIANQDTEPTYNQGEKWMCLSCIGRVEKRKQKDVEGSRKKKTQNIQEYFKTKLLHEDKAKKLQEFQTKYPSYVQQGRVVFPILDEYLTAYQGLFGVEIKRKPAPKLLSIDSADILIIWDSYNNMQKIISDLLYAESTANIGTLIHFKDNCDLYTVKTREQINDEIENNPRYLILFFCYFYLKQLIEDLDIEQQQKIQYKKPYWHLLGYLWFANRKKYYQIIRHEYNNLPTQICNQQILRMDKQLLKQFEEHSSNPDSIVVRKILVGLVEGLTELKKTQFILQFRTENLLSNNRMKVQLGQEIKTQRSNMVDENKQYSELELELANVRQQQVSNGEIKRQESSKLNRQAQTLQSSMQKCKQNVQKMEKEVNLLTERYNQLEQVNIIQYTFFLKQKQQELQIIQIPALILNPSMFLGNDYKNCEYYYFLYESDKIFVFFKESLLDDDMKWGYYDFEDVDNLINSLCTKGVKENQLRNNIQELVKYKLLAPVQIGEKNIESEKKENPMELEVDPEEEDDENDNQFENEAQPDNQPKQLIVNGTYYDESLPEFTNNDLNSDFLNIENSLTQYLGQKQSRWCNSEYRINFRKRIDKSDNYTALQQAIEYFVENTMMQEKLELRPEEETEDKQYDNEDSSQNHYQSRKRKVVEDESSVDDQTYLQQLEQLDNNKVRVRKLPMKLFGTYYENLRINLIEQVKNIEYLTQLKIVLEVLGQIVKDYIDRKKVNLPIQPEKKVYEEPIKQQLQQEQPPSQQRVRVTQNLRKRSQFKPQYNEVENRWDDFCKVCGSGGKVICCDTCPSVFHAKCINLKEIPQGKWNCLKCLSNFERQVKTRATIKKLENQQ